MNRTFAHNMRRYLHERLSRFEAEVTFFRLNNESDDFMPQFRITSPFHYMDCELCRRGAFGGIGVLNAPMSSSYAYQYHRHHHHRANFGGGFAASGGPEFDTEANSKSEPSVTNLMYVQVIDGCLNI